MPKATRRATCKASQPDPCVVPLDRSTRTRTRQKAAPVVSAKPTRNRRLPKKPAFGFLSRSQAEVEANPNRQIRLFKLPRELVQDIASRLSLAGAICLTLTCKEAADAVGIQSWSEYKKEKQYSLDRTEFSSLIVRDWGHHFDFCPRCNALHPPIQPPRTHRTTKLTKCCFGQDAIIDYLP